MVAGKKNRDESSEEYNSGSEEEVAHNRSLRSAGGSASKKTSKGRTTPSRQARRRIAYTNSSDEEEDRSESPAPKKKKSSRRGQAEEKEAKTDADYCPTPENGADGEDDEEREPIRSKPSTSSATKKVTYKKPAAKPNDSDSDSCEFDALRNSPPKESAKEVRKQIFSVTDASNSTPRNHEMNGSARTSAKQEIIPDVGNQFRDMIHCLKINTAMMGDLSAELRLFRETMVSMNWKK